MSGFASPNHTQTPNELFDMYMPLMHESELKVVMAIVRKTLGYKKDRDPISLSQLIKMTGLSRQGVLDGTQAAIERGLVAIAGHGKRGTTIYQLVYSVDQSTEETRTSLPSRPELVYPVDTQKKLSKRNSPKETNTLAELPKSSKRSKVVTIDNVTPEPHIALIEAYLYSLPEDIRPSTAAFGRYHDLAVRMVKNGITPYDVVRYITAESASYRVWASEHKAKPAMSLNHVDQEIKGWLQTHNRKPKRANADYTIIEPVIYLSDTEAA